MVSLVCAEICSVDFINIINQYYFINSCQCCHTATGTTK